MSLLELVELSSCFISTDDKLWPSSCILLFLRPFPIKLFLFVCRLHRVYGVFVPSLMLASIPFRSLVQDKFYSYLLIILKLFLEASRLKLSFENLLFKSVLFGEIPNCYDFFSSSCSFTLNEVYFSTVVFLQFSKALSLWMISGLGDIANNRFKGEQLYC